MAKSQELLKGVFPEYRNRAEYKAAFGVDAPPFDVTRKIKLWQDPSAGSDGLPEVIYNNAVMTKKDGTFVLKNNKPVIKPIVLPVDEAKSVNLPPEDEKGNTGEIESWMPPIQNPFRDLVEGEEIVVAGPDMGLLSGKFLVIRNTKLWAEEQAAALEESGKFTVADRQLLTAIAAKLGVEG